MVSRAQATRGAAEVATHPAQRNLAMLLHWASAFQLALVLFPVALIHLEVSCSGLPEVCSPMLFFPLEYPPLSDSELQDLLVAEAVLTVLPPVSETAVL